MIRNSFTLVWCNNLPTIGYDPNKKYTPKPTMSMAWQFPGAPSHYCCTPPRTKGEILQNSQESKLSLRILPKRWHRLDRRRRIHSQFIAINGENHVLNNFRFCPPPSPFSGKPLGTALHGFIPILCTPKVPKWFRRSCFPLSVLHDLGVTPRCLDLPTSIVCWFSDVGNVNEECWPLHILYS